MEAACHNYGLSPRRLMLEVTETAMLVETELALANAHALLNSGTRLALDDFCTGHSRWRGCSPSRSTGSR